MQVAGLTSGVQAITLGYNNTCALVNGGLKCWGENSFGKLGICSGISRTSMPTDITGLTTGVQSISASMRGACALVNGGVKCWGYNSYGEAGDGTGIQRTAPVNATGLTSGVSSITTGTNFSCAIVNGGMKCWGAYEIGSTTSPTDVSGYTTNVQLLNGGYSAGCLMTNGLAKCWGNNTNGKLGDGTTTNRTTPVDVLGL